MERVFKKKFLKLKESVEKKIKRITINESHLTELNIAVNNTSSNVSNDIKNTFRNAQRELGYDKAKKADYVVAGDDVNESVDDSFDVVEKVVRQFFNDYDEYNDYDTYHDYDGKWLYDSVMDKLTEYYNDMTGEEVNDEINKLFEKEFAGKMDLYEAKVVTKKQIMEVKNQKNKYNVECYCCLNADFMPDFLRFLKKTTTKNMNIDIDPENTKYNLKFKGNLQINDYNVDLLDNHKHCTKIYFDAQSPEDLKKFLNHLSEIGSGGHSFEIKINGKHAFYFDGDGSDYICKVK